MTLWAIKDKIQNNRYSGKEFVALVLEILTTQLFFETKYHSMSREAKNLQNYSFWRKTM